MHSCIFWCRVQRTDFTVVENRLENVASNHLHSEFVALILRFHIGENLFRLFNSGACLTYI